MITGKVITVTQTEAQKLIKNYKKGTFFTVEFVKRSNGKIRVMNCRKGVHKGLRGGGLSFNPKKKRLVSVFDIPKKAHRFISLDDIKRISIDKKHYLVK